MRSIHKPRIISEKECLSRFHVRNPFFSLHVGVLPSGIPKKFFKKIGNYSVRLAPGFSYSVGFGSYDLIQPHLILLDNNERSLTALMFREVICVSKDSKYKLGDIVVDHIQKTVELSEEELKEVKRELGVNPSVFLFKEFLKLIRKEIRNGKRVILYNVMKEDYRSAGLERFYKMIRDRFFDRNGFLDKRKRQVREILEKND